MNYLEYYAAPFRNDLHKVLSALPSAHTSGRKAVIQPRTLSTENPVIKSWDQSRIDLFATALYYTILIDQICHYHYRSQYSEFEKLTRYPKLLGDCPGGCAFGYADPSMILNSIGSSSGPAGGWVDSVSLAPESELVMHKEVSDFFIKHMPSINGEEFWNIVLRELSKIHR